MKKIISTSTAFTQRKSNSPRSDYSLCESYERRLPTKAINNNLSKNSDNDLSLSVNVSLATIKLVFDAVKLFNPDFQQSDFTILLWYLSVGQSTFKDVASVFNISSEEEVFDKLEEISSQLLCLQKNAKMDLPSTLFEEDTIVENFKEQTGIENVLGALGCIKVDYKDGSWLGVLAICDHSKYFRHISFFTSSNLIHEVIQNSPIYDRLLEDHPKGYFYVCPPQGYPLYPRLFPCLQEDELSNSPERRYFQLVYMQIVNHLRTSIKETFIRFPKLASMEVPSTKIVTAAFILHNLCIQTRDNRINWKDKGVYELCPFEI